MRVIVDARWIGNYGIQRYSAEVLKRAPFGVDVIPIRSGPRPSSPLSPFWFAAGISRLGKAVVFSPGYMPPAWCGSPFVFTMHDLIHTESPTRSAALKRIFYNKIIRPAALRAARILTVSEYSRSRILDWLGIEPSRVMVTGNGVDPFFCPSEEPADATRPYVLYVGGGKPHKNLVRLVQAFSAASIPAEVSLHLSGPPHEDIVREASRLGISQRIVFTGMLTEAQLRTQYRNALALILPSLNEGFGLPVVEAMACGTPVVASNATALPEVVGSAGLLVDPYDVDSIAAGISRIVADAELRAALRARGLERAALFSWDRTAKRAWDAVEEAGCLV